MRAYNNSWSVIYTRPKHEKKIVDELTGKCLTFYFPTRKVIRVWHDRKKIVEEPFFPSYIFVLLRNAKDFYDTLKINGVLQYVRFGKEIAVVNDKVIDEMKTFISSGHDVEVTTQHFQPGQKLIIRYGPLTGIPCEVVQSKGKQKILVRTEMLQRNLLISMPQENLIAVPA